MLDTSGDALRQGVAGRPHILKINQEELNPAALTLGLAAAASVVMNEASDICRQSQVETLKSQVQVMRVNG